MVAQGKLGLFTSRIKQKVHVCLLFPMNVDEVNEIAHCITCNFLRSSGFFSPRHHFRGAGQVEKDCLQG